MQEVEHSLTGSCRQLGAGEMARLSAALDAAGAAADLDAVPRTVQDLGAEFARVTDQCTTILAEEGTR